MATTEPFRVQIVGLEDLEKLVREFREAAKELRHAAEAARKTGEQVNRAAATARRV